MPLGLISLPPRLKPRNSGATTQKNGLQIDILAMISSTLSYLSAFTIQSSNGLPSIPRMITVPEEPQ